MFVYAKIFFLTIALEFSHFDLCALEETSISGFLSRVQIPQIFTRLVHALDQVSLFARALRAVKT